MSRKRIHSEQAMIGLEPLPLAIDFGKNIEETQKWMIEQMLDQFVLPPDVYAGTEHGSGISRAYESGYGLNHMMFQQPVITTRDKALDLQPIIRCPNCGEPVSNFASATQQYQPPAGMLGTFDCPFPDLLTRMHYAMEPCGCRVTPEWAAEFTKEINRRMAGEMPLSISDMTSTQRHVQVKRIEGQIGALYSRLDRANHAEAKARIQYYLVIAIDHLMRLTPGAHNCVKPIALDPEVRTWAEKHNYQTPPTTTCTNTPSEVPDFGYPPDYKMPKLPGASKTANLPSAPPVITPVAPAPAEPSLLDQLRADRPRPVRFDLD